MNDLQKIIMILRDYESDREIGYVLDLDNYVQSRCAVLNIPDLKKTIIELINSTRKPVYCTLNDTKS